MVGSQHPPSPPPDALQSEIALLRGAVAALRTTRQSSARDAARKEATAITKRRLTTSTAVAFMVGVAVTLSVLAMIRVAMCP